MKKTIGILLIMVISFWNNYSPTSIEAASYMSESTISFTKKQSEDLTDNPSYIPSGVVDTTMPSEYNRGDYFDVKESTLPKTSTNTYFLLAVGFGLIVCGIIGLFYYHQTVKKKSRKSCYPYC